MPKYNEGTDAPLIEWDDIQRYELRYDQKERNMLAEKYGFKDWATLIEDFKMRGRAIDNLILHANTFEAKTSFSTQKFKVALREKKSPAECYKAYAEDIDAFYRWAVHEVKSSFALLMDVADEYAEESGGSKSLPKITCQVLVAEDWDKADEE